MCKDRLRSVKWSKWRSSPPPPVLTTARVGPYGILYTIYIRPYGIRGATLTPWILHPTKVTGSQIHRITDSQVTKPPDHQTTRITGSPSHQTPWINWLAGLIGSPIFTHPHQSPKHIGSPFTPWLTIGSPEPQTHRLTIWYLDTLTHRSHRY